VAAKVDLTAGVPGMPAANSGGGKAGATKVTFGSGDPGSQATGGFTGVRKVAGLTTGAPGGTGNAPGGQPVKPVMIATNQPPPPPPTGQIRTSPMQSPPKVISQPSPVYTDEARQMHIQGDVLVHIRVSATGAVQVLNVARGLGHGLDDNAIRAAQGIKFQPALDASGKPIDWEGNVKVTFQIAG
jgi:TonB family protein